MDLKLIRGDIDSIDEKIFDLLESRFYITKEVAIQKYLDNLDIENVEREIEIINSLSDSSLLFKNSIESIYNNIFEISKKQQKEIINKLDKIKSENILKEKNLVLIGMPGSGKTTIGKIIASILDVDFFDLDEEIYKYKKMHPSEIILEHGEEYFRNIESEVLGKVVKNRNCVLSTGGGVIIRDQNIDLLRNEFIVYLDRKIELLEVEGRPLSKNGEDLESLYNERHDIYESVSLFTVENRTKLTTAYEIICNIEKYS